MLSNDDSTKTSINVQSPFKKVTNYSNNPHKKIPPFLGEGLDL